MIQRVFKFVKSMIDRIISLKPLWPWVLTVIVILVAISVFCFTPLMERLSQLGDYIAGFASTIAFIWLIAAYLQQGKELKLQREELVMQRQSLDFQRIELKRMGKYSALEQISRILDQFNSGLQNNDNSPVNNANDLPMAFINGMKDWKLILESKDPDIVFNAYVKWMKIYGSCTEFLERIVSAVEIYLEATDQISLTTIGTSAECIYFDFEKIRNIPHVRHYIGAAYALASNIVITEPGLDRIQLNGLEAMEKLHPGVVKAAALAEFRAKVAKHEAS